MRSRTTFLLVILLCCSSDYVVANWDDWWTYEGISGPAYWGLINPAWTMCNKGQRQSPINIDPTSLTYDSRLGAISIDKHLVSVKITNTGQTLVLKVAEDEVPVNITGGPLAYKYQFQEMIFHWGEKGSPGSEHTVNEYAFPAEIQLYGFNSALYQNLSTAREYPGGVVGVAIMVRVKEESPRLEHDHMHSGLGHIISKLSSIKYSGDTTRVKQISLATIMPNTADYVTYEGSTTFPGCWETTTWVVMNKLVYISKQELDMFYQLRQGDTIWEKAALGNNLRPRQPLNNRMVRTNIALQAQKCEGTLLEVQYTASEGSTAEDGEDGEDGEDEYQDDHCSQGQRQSPINIDPTSLTYDSRLSTISIDKHRVSAKNTNTGQTLVLKVAEDEVPVNITGGHWAQAASKGFLIHPSSVSCDWTGFGFPWAAVLQLWYQLW